MSVQSDSRAEKTDHTPRLERSPDWRDTVIAVLCVAWLSALVMAVSVPPDPMPDFGNLDTAERKAAFFDYLKPLVAKVNGRTRSEREFVREMLDKRESGARPSWFERRRIESLAKQYEVDTEGEDLDAVLAMLDRRIGIIPDSLALIQAAKESAWGTSRFAVEGNNFFGQRCYDRGCGIAPSGRENPRFGLAAFDSVEEAVESYVLNLNTHPRYERFRDIRHTLRAGEKPLKGLDLAAGLLRYSERGQAYVDEIKSMIRQNDLE